MMDTAGHVTKDMMVQAPCCVASKDDHGRSLRQSLAGAQTQDGSIDFETMIYKYGHFGMH